MIFFGRKGSFNIGMTVTYNTSLSVLTALFFKYAKKNKEQQKNPT